MLETLLVGIALFASTNIDDVFLTMAFFADPGLRPRAIVAGKYAGIAVLVAASAAAAACAWRCPASGSRCSASRRWASASSGW